MMRYGFGTGGYGFMGGFGGFIMTLFMFFLLALVILGILALVRYLQLSRKPSATVDDNAVNILNERYARGEINDDEYSAKKTALSKK